MNTFKTTLALFLVLLAAIASEPVLAQHRGHFHGHARFGVFIGGPVFWPGYYYPPSYYYRPYYYPPYYYSPAVTVPYSPPVYIEQGSSQPAPTQSAPAPSPGYWYYCANAKAYYPYVKECPGGWQRVAPQPPPNQIVETTP